MMAGYKAVFLIPASAKKIFDDTGWAFETKNRLRVTVLDALKQAFLLQFAERYLGIEAYVGDGVKVNVIYDEEGLIEHISIQLWERTAKELKEALHEFGDVDIFIPSDAPSASV